MSKIKEYTNTFPDELKCVFIDSPQDDIDWALVMYLFRHSSVRKSSFLFEEKNVITVGKITKFFNLEYNDVYRRLQRMIWWIDISTVYGYYKPINVCSITQVGADIIMSMTETLSIKIDEIWSKSDYRL